MSQKYVVIKICNQKCRGPRLTARGTLTRNLGATSRGPLHCESRSLVARQVEVPVDKIRLMIKLSFGRLSTPLAKISYTTDHYYQKYEIFPKILFLVKDPCKDTE